MKLGCLIVQGHTIALPMPVESLMQWMKQWQNAG
jgi:hypothetical protein